MKKLNSAGIILFRDIGKREYLILMYNTSDHYWGFAKGSIENNETEQEAALREVEEETGLKDVKLIPDFKEKDNYEFEENGEEFFKEVTWFLGEVESSNVILSHEHEDFKWSSYEEALESLSFKELKELLKKAETKLS